MQSYKHYIKFPCNWGKTGVKSYYLPFTPNKTPDIYCILLIQTLHCREE